ncbi:LOW QUALITY PROTEIN: helicase with zinc finger domain 2-like [Gigantopelta aegis]|uniref:LOW QUALITY PROTEIN: helicase with zinc finger domain 2-like n=1 Tax=Gigantopelta aegis TaxID=1735272 RepID=UPI001B88A8D1|nr:LOW QUALITY PROTEIN: helicase with zinc finger domain 2-like [Gigantopelta aegis]
MVPQCNSECQKLTSFLSLNIKQKQMNIGQVFKDLTMLARKHIDVKPAFCFILTTDLCHLSQFNPSSLRELLLLQARSALNGKSFDLAMKLCKHAEENIFDYENSEGFLIWAEALELTGNIMAAFEKAQLAKTHSQNEAERRRSQAYCDTLQDKVKGLASSTASNQVDKSWLVGTNAFSIKREQEKATAVKDSHIPKKKRSKPKRKRTVSSCTTSSNSNNNSNHVGQIANLNTRASEQNNKSSHSSDISSVDSLQTQSQGPQFDEEERLDVASLEFPDYDNWDCSDEEEMRMDSELDDPVYTDDSESDDDFNIMAQCESENPDQTWFEESKEIFENGINNENNPRFCIGSGMNLSEKDVAKFFNSRNQDPRRKPFYRDFIQNEYLHQLLKSEPNRYKRCRIEIESAQKAICKILGSAGVETNIEIAGRSKCGQCFNNDEVAVEILFRPKKPYKHKSSSVKTDSKTYGEVVGVLNSNFFRNSKYPILACTSNEIDGWLMRPLCKSIPKIHVINTVTRNKTPNLTRYRTDIYELVGSKLKYKGKFDANPTLRGQYVFIVVYLGWGNKYVYPLGAVLGVLQCGKDFNSSLKILEMQYKVPSLFPNDTVSQIKTILDQGDKFDATGREDKTNDLVFTIDPPQSKDLDDALSISKQNNNYIVGVHIADVASVVKKDDAVDKEARKRAVSFYVQNKRTHNMLPEPLSQDICSLVPDIKRPALSVFLTFNPNGKLVKTIVKKTVIKSTRKFSYEEVQNIIDNEPNTESSQLKSSIIALNNLAQKIREERLKDARFSVPFEDVRFCDMEEKGNCDEAHALVEEFMIKTNAACKILKERFSKYLPLRCQTAPATEDVYAWLKKESRIVDVLVHLQGKKVLPNMVISASEGIHKCAAERTEFIPIQSDIWKSILESLEKSRFNEAEKMICTDEIHPLQNVGWIHWIKLLDIAEYRCSGVISDTKANHFSLDIQPYIHFTSPIRRYVDLVSHRLVHAILSGDACPYTVDDIQQICDDVNEATSRQKAFDRSCKVLAKTEKMGKSSVVFHAIVDVVTENGLELLLPGLRSVPSKCREIRFCLLDLSKKPEMTKDTETNKDNVICQWRKRLYDTTGCPNQALFNRLHIHQPDECVVVDPNQHTVLVRFQDWANILNGIFTKNISAVQKTVRPLLPTGAANPRSYSRVVDFITSETGQGTIKNHQSKFKRSFIPGQVVKVQLGASPNNGLLLPKIELVHITQNLSLCHTHLDDPVGILSKYATRSVKQHFHSIDEYKKAWLPVIEMEAAVSAASGELTPIINNVHFTLKPESVSDKTFYTGSFQLPVSFCDERNIEFRGVPVRHLPEDKDIHKSTLKACDLRGLGSNDYLCIRCFVPGPPGSGCRDVENGMTWIGHGQIVRAVLNEKQTYRSDLENDKVIVTFVLNDNSTPPPASLTLKRKIKGTAEIIYKKEVDRRTQNAIQSLKKTKDSEPTGSLARAIVLGGQLPCLSRERLKIAKELDKEVTGDKYSPMPKNNTKQYEAIENALKKSFSLIQGPPGTGKTYTGIKLIYLFNEINAKVRSEGGKKCQVLFCGPSNKSVDMVARYLQYRLSTSCPNLIRMYGSNIVSQDYPVPKRDLISRRSMHDLKSDSELRGITLHHVIRERGDYADEIKKFDVLFALMLKENKTNEDKAQINKYIQNVQQKQKKSEERQIDPDKAIHSITKKYIKLVSSAYAEELEKCEVILCTCSVGGNPKIVKATNIYQCIIDEAAMCPEPLAMVPIIATDAKQVVLIGDHKQLRPIIQCSEAAELGMEQSLFERYSLKESILTFLDTQYRMHPEICKFPSTQFYEGKLKTGRKFREEEFPLRLWPNSRIPHVFCHVEGLEEMLTVSTEEGNEASRSNMAEVDKVVQVYRWLIERGHVGSKQIVVLSQYNSQVFVLKKNLTEYKVSSRNPERHYMKLNVSTIVSSQGSESDYVIFSTVRSLPSYKIEPAPTLGWCRQNLGFITDANQINVALTRARKGLIIIGNKNLLEVDEVWRNLLRSYEREGCLTDSRCFPNIPRPRPRNFLPVD